MTSATTRPLDVVIIGAGVAGIYQIKRLIDLGFDALVLEANADLGGTWFRNRYPGCRFDSESYTYGYSFSRELLDEWHWKERFSPQPENLKYLNHVADKFDLRRHIRFNSSVAAMEWDEAERLWTVELDGGETYTARFIISCVGILSAPVMPEIAGIDDFEGESFHTFYWPEEPVALAGRNVGIIGTGATAIQIIPEIVGEVGELFVFQRRANWSIPLNNSAISEEAMADIRARYDEIFAQCAQSNGAFVHLPDRRDYHTLTQAERLALWDELYDRPGFALLLANFPETFLEEDANRALSAYVAERVRQRLDDPETAEKLIPKDHGFGMRRLPLETGYFEAYNRDNVELVDISEAPIDRITRTGIEAGGRHFDLDLIVYATGFDAVLGGLNRIDIRGAGGQSLREKWGEETSTYLGLMTHGFPNMLMIAGPQSVSGSTNYPRAIEDGVDWVTQLLVHARDAGHSRIEPERAAEQAWTDEVVRMQERMPFSRVESWFTGYVPNAEGKGAPVRYNAYWGGAPKYRGWLEEAAAEGYRRLAMD